MTVGGSIANLLPDSALRDVHEHGRQREDYGATGSNGRRCDEMPGSEVLLPVLQPETAV